MRPSYSSFIDIFKQGAEKYGDKIALIEGDNKHSYKQVFENAKRVATFLNQYQVKDKEVVAILSQNCVDYVETEVGIIMTGAILFKLNWRLSAAEYRELLDQNETRIIFYNLNAKDRLDVIEELGRDGKYIFINMQDLQNKLSQFKQFEDYVERGPNDVLMHLHTSGTTGHPKVVRYLHKTFVDAIIDVREANKFTEDVIFQGMIQLFHSACTGTYSIMMSGASVVYLRNFEVNQYLESVSKNKVNWLSTIPTVLSAILSLPNLDKFDLSHVRMISYSTCPMPPSLIEKAREKFPGCGFLQCYGMTEIGSGITCLRPEHHENGNPNIINSVGKPMENHEVRIERPDGSICEPMESGEVIVRGDGMMLDYYKNPEATKKALREDGWLKTGDGGYLDKEGFLFLEGRLDDMIITGGDNVYPREVEVAMRTNPEVKDVAVVGVPDPHWIQAINAFVVLEKNSTLTENDLKEFLRGKIARYKVPKKIFFVKDFPRTATGKIVSSKLVEMAMYS